MTACKLTPGRVFSHPNLYLKKKKHLVNYNAAVAPVHFQLMEK
jgi:hypothetical protein